MNTKGDTEGYSSDASSAQSEDTFRVAAKISKKTILARLERTKGYCPPCRQYSKQIAAGTIHAKSQEVLDHISTTHKNPVKPKLKEKDKKPSFPPPTQTEKRPLDSPTERPQDKAPKLNEEPMKITGGLLYKRDAFARPEKPPPKDAPAPERKGAKTNDELQTALQLIANLSATPPKIDQQSTSTGITRDTCMDQFLIAGLHPRTAPPPPIKLTNKYQPLTDMETDTDDETTTRPQITKPKKTHSPKQKAKDTRPPPIIMKGVVTSRDDYKKLTDDLKLIMKDYTLKFTKNNTIIYCTNMKDYNACKIALQLNEKAEFHTYATRDQKTHAFVVKGLDNDPDPEEIKQELIEEHNLEIKSVHVMKTRYRQLYLIVTSSKHKLQELQKIRRLYRTTITWERRRQNTDILQCKRCCQWGHATSNCHRAPRCNNCAEQHLTKDCTTPDKTKCANCGGAHKSQDTSCNVYTYKLDKLTRQKTPPQTEQPRYIPAPLPTKNAWAPLPGTQIPAWKNQGDVELGTSRLTQNTQPGRATERSYAGEKNQIGDLVEAMKELNKVVDLSELLRFITDFTAMMRNKPADEKAMAALQFIQNIESYKI